MNLEATENLKKGNFYFLSSLLINNSTNVFTKFLEGRNQPKKILSATLIYIKRSLLIL